MPSIWFRKRSISITCTINRPLQSGLYDVFAVSILLFGVLTLVLALLKGFFLFLVRQTLIVMSRHVEYDLKNEIYDHYQTLPLSFYRQHNTGDLMARISEDVNKVRMYVGPSIMYGLNLIILFILVITYMVSINARLSLYVLLPLRCCRCPFILSITSSSDGRRRFSGRCPACRPTCRKLFRVFGS